jgi:hypothetical protein
MTARKKSTKVAKKKPTRRAPARAAPKKRKAGPRVVRCSSLLYASRCHAAIAQEEEVREQFSIPAQISSEASRLGVAYHDLQAFSQKRGYESAREQIQPIARKHGADARELGWLWSRLRVDSSVDFFDAIHVEEKLSARVAPGLMLEGTPDLVRLYNKKRALDVTDWKSGRLAISDDPDAYDHDQVISYAVLAAAENMDVGTARAIVYPVRLGDRPTIYAMDAKALAAETERIFKLVETVDAQRSLKPTDRDYGLGDHCRWCDGRRTCPAYRKDMEAAVALVNYVEAHGKGSKAKNDEQKALVQRKVEEAVSVNPLAAFTYMRLAGRLKDALKEALKHDAEFWGSFDTEDGKYLGLNEYKAPATLTADFARQQIVQVLNTRLGNQLEGAELSSIVDEIVELLSDRPLMDRQRFGHWKKKD